MPSVRIDHRYPLGSHKKVRILYSYIMFWIHGQKHNGFFPVTYSWKKLRWDGDMMGFRLSIIILVPSFKLLRFNRWVFFFFCFSLPFITLTIDIGIPCLLRTFSDCFSVYGLLPVEPVPRPIMNMLCSCPPPPQLIATWDTSGILKLVSDWIYQWKRVSDYYY